jgi:hypothetical protein
MRFPDCTGPLQIMLRQALGGKPFTDRELSKCGYVQNLGCSFSEVPGFQVLDSVRGGAYSVRMARNPLLRVLSAWKSKVRCANCTKGGRRDPFRKYDASNPNKCKTFRAFVDSLATTRQNIDRWDEHWRPQAILCSGAFHDVVKLEDVQPDSFAPLLKYWGVPYVAYPHTHASGRHGNDNSRAVPQPDADRLSKYTEVLERIYDLYDMDYRALGYDRRTEVDVALVMSVFEYLGETCF